MKGMRYILALLLLLQVKCLFAQQNKESVKASLIYYFIEYVEWPQESKMEQYKLGVLSNDKLLYDELLQISKIRKIKNKPVHVIKLTNDELIPPIDVLFAGSEYNASLTSISQKIASRHILLISDNFTERYLTMINFVQQDGDLVVYEANKQNLRSEGFSYRKELLIYGGTQVDIRELLTEAEVKLKVVIDSIRLLETQIGAREKELNIKNNTIDELYASINEYKTDINDYQSEIDRKNIQFNELSQQIDSKQRLLDEKNQELITQKHQQQAIIAEIENKRNDLGKARKSLEQLKLESAKQHQMISKQTGVLFRQAGQLQTQRRQILLIILLLIVTLLAIITLFRSYRFKRKANEELSVSNEQLLANQEELQQTIMKLRETQDQLIQAEKMASLGMLTAGIAHEINNPINFINSANELLPDITEEIEKKDNSGELVQNLRFINSSIQTGVERTTQIISSLRNYIRLENDVFVSHYLPDSLNDAILILSNKHKDRINIQLDIGDIPQVQCIPGKIYQVFVNLISNAIDAISGKGDINISMICKAPGSEVEISIRDSGSGISKENLSKIFNPFFSTKEVGKGTGLGLYIVYGIIQQHNGSVSAESEVGKGTTFRIKIPVKNF